jgi:LPXTG-motif cell wall-anchored protein
MDNTTLSAALWIGALLILVFYVMRRRSRRSLR